MAGWTILNAVMCQRDADTEWMDAESLVPLCKPGDLIEFQREAFCHWAMYSDEPGNVFNVDAESPKDSEAWISLRSLVHVANLGSVPELRRVRINNKAKSALRKNVNARPAHEAIQAARGVLYSEVPYNFFTKNCEYYCCEWKFGKGWSDQVESPALLNPAVDALTLGVLNPESPIMRATSVAVKEVIDVADSTVSDVGKFFTNEVPEAASHVGNFFTEDVPEAASHVENFFSRIFS